MVIIDLHVDTLPWILLGYDINKSHKLKSETPCFHVDIARIKVSGITAIFLGIVTPPFISSFAWRTVLKQIDTYKKIIEKNPVFLKGEGPSSIEKAYKEGKFALFLGLEGLHPLGEQFSKCIERIDYLKREGVIYITLVHFSSSIAGYPVKGVGSREDRGLTELGIKIIEYMNEQKILVDLAHINKKGFMEAIKICKLPPIVSHTGIKGVYNHWRNIDDDEIRGVAERGGVIGIMLSRRFLGGNSIDTVIAHFKYLRKKGGIEVVAIGTDFDGLVIPPSPIKDITGIRFLLEALSKAGFSDSELELIAWRNVIRVLREAGF